MITVCDNRQEVIEFMALPEVSRYAREYGSGELTFTSKELWLLYDDKGMINIHVETGAMCQFHPYILKRHKTLYNSMVREFFEWFVCNMPAEAVKLNAVIPDIFKGAILAAERAGMTLEGVDSLSYRSANGVHDRLMFGISREQMRSQNG